MNQNPTLKTPTRYALAAALLTTAGPTLAQSTTARISRPQPTRAPATPAPQPVPPPPLEDPTGKPPKRVADPSAIQLAEEPVTLDTVGMTFFPPLDSVVSSTSVANESVLSVSAKDEAWQINIRTPNTSKDDITAEAAGEAVVRQLLEAVGQKTSDFSSVRTLGKILERQNALVFDPERPDLLAYRAYVSLPQPRNKPDEITGYTIVKISPRQFVAFELVTTEPNFAAARRTYETVIASARFDKTGAVLEDRAAAVQAGVKLFERLTREDFEAAIATRNDRWERLFIPSKTGADSDEKEVAYRRVRCRLGARAELDQKAPPTSAPEPEGYIFQIDARYLDGQRTWDSQSTFFLSFDRQEEIWTIRNTVRDGDKAVGTTETGLRSGRTMTVQTSGTGQPTKTIEPVFETDGYISQIESFLLPQLLVRSQRPGGYGFYSYQSTASQIKLRRDVLEQPIDRPGLWKLTSKLSEDARKSQVSLFNDSGELIRTQLPDGQIWEPTTLEKLLRLWRDKNLPMK